MGMWQVYCFFCGGPCNTEDNYEWMNNVRVLDIGPGGHKGTISNIGKYNMYGGFSTHEWMNNMRTLALDEDDDTYDVYDPEVEKIGTEDSSTIIFHDSCWNFVGKSDPDKRIGHFFLMNQFQTKKYDTLRERYNVLKKYHFQYFEMEEFKNDHPNDLWMLEDPLKNTVHTPVQVVPTVTKSRAKYLLEIAVIAVSYGFVPFPVRGEVIVQDKVPQWNNANNIAIFCGEASNVVVFDIGSVKSPTSKSTGVKYWNQLITLNNKGNPLELFPETFIVRTPSNGFHVYFQYDERMPSLSNSNEVLGQKIDFITNGGSVLFPGSKNFATGKEYAVLSGFKNNKPMIARMPSWLYDFIAIHQQQMTQKTTQKIGKIQKT